jgi:predicted acyltransferase
MVDKARKTSQTRIEAIDQFRGLAIVLMVLVNELAGAKIIPAWLKHAPDIGLTIADLVAPFFIFAIGLTIGLSFRRRLERDGANKTYQHFFTRFMALIGIGAIITGGEMLIGYSTDFVNWGVLQAIGVAGLLTLPTLALQTAWRWGIGLTLLAGYQILLDRFWLGTVLSSSHGGMFGALSWTAMLILATAMADYFNGNKGKKGRFYLVTGLVLAAGIGLVFISPISKNRVSSSYVLVSLGASGLVFAIFDVLAGKFKAGTRWLETWGKNPLLLYMLHFMLLAFYALPSNPGWYVQAPLWLAFLQAVVLIAVLNLIALFLERKNLILSL